MVNVVESQAHTQHTVTPQLSPHASEKRVPLRPLHCLAAATKFTTKRRAVASPRLRGEAGEQRVTRRRRVRPARRWARRLIRRRCPASSRPAGSRPASSRPAGEQLCARGLPMVRVRVRVSLTLTLTTTLTLTCPCSCAVCSAVCPCWLRSAAEAPCASSSEISGAWPWAAAACSGVSRPAPHAAAPGWAQG